MWKNLQKLISPVLHKETNFLATATTLQTQIRTTYILKRKYQPFLHKKGSVPKRLRSRHFIYEVVRNTDVEPKPNLDVILTTYVDGLGNIGDKVSLRPTIAYNNYLLPGLAVYASPENLEKYKNVDTKERAKHSSPTAQITADTLSRITLSVIMSMENPWTLQPWHIRTSFRKCGYWVPEETITLPPKPIKGPDMNIQNKEFYITVTINNLEKTNVRCRIHHWSTEVVNRIIHKHEFWKEPSDPIFPEDAPVLANIPSGPLQTEKLS